MPGMGCFVLKAVSHVTWYELFCAPPLPYASPKLINLRMRHCAEGSNVVVASQESIMTIGLVLEH